MTTPPTPTQNTIKKGDYVLATKYNDGDPGDAWAVGYYIGCDEVVGHVRHHVGNDMGCSYRLNGFRRVGLIEKDFGAWLLSGKDFLERSPPGTVNLWGMQEGTCRTLEKIA